LTVLQRRLSAARVSGAVKAILWSEEMAERSQIEKGAKEESAEERMARARQWVRAIIEHSRGSNPVFDFCQRDWKWRISLDGNKDYTPGAFPPPPCELFKEIVDVCYELGRVDATGAILDHHRAGEIRA
jgi:hypothetical protein